MANNDNESPSGTQSLFRGLQLMEELSNYPNGCPLARLAEETGLSKSTAHRLLQGLQSAGYVTAAPTHGSYRLTTKCVAVGQKALSSLNVIHVAARHVEALNLDTGETVNLSSLEDGRAIMIYKLEANRGMIRTRAYVGQHISLYCSAMGKLFLTHAFKGKIDAYWESHRDEITTLTRNTITDLAAMHKEIAAIEKCGYAVDREENEMGICCVAAPIFDVMGNMPYSVSVSLTTAKLKELGEKAVAAKVIATAQKISQELGG
ncbi:IclR family transcriptional regulator [Propionivibrio dicarboxylicus]|uniref:Transcriptional regulator, IclR family n=1 Tax=Propionivibrio dicarboxylicus TaxID=83767 RepID=A0A1G8KK95_9RHOO|nr:IclR family transcriptional regulator [Propionivibrio dicarboxylicus]SDI43857.1 transcriptional regulator, IclR family [Propionivibrio dicarboxylicus]